MAFKKVLVYTLAITLFLGKTAQGVQLQRHSNWSAGRESNEKEDESFAQLSFVDDEENEPQGMEMIDMVYDQMKYNQA